MFEEVVLAPDSRLKQECEPIEEITQEIKDLANHMLDVMYASNGCGLAGSQIGIMKQICVIDTDWGPGSKKNPYVLINPEIKQLDGPEVCGNEGCLSYPGISVEVSRPTHVVVHARNLDGKLLKYEASNNLLCVCLQHEIDHLHGVTMVDHLSPAKKIVAMRDYKRAQEAGAKPGEC